MLLTIISLLVGCSIGVSLSKIGKPKIDTPIEKLNTFISYDLYVHIDSWDSKEAFNLSFDKPISNLSINDGYDLNIPSLSLIGHYFIFDKKHYIINDYTTKNYTHITSILLKKR